MNSKQIVDSLRKRYGLKETDPVGVVATHGETVEVDANPKNRDLIVVINTDDIDMDGEVVLPAGGDVKSYLERNKKVFADHEYTLDKVLGTIRSIVPFPNAGNIRGWKARIHLDTNELSEKVLRLAREGGMGASIGFVASDVGPPTDEERRKYANGRDIRAVVRRWKALEFSMTAMPCNVACQTVPEVITGSGTGRKRIWSICSATGGVLVSSVPNT